MQQEFDNLTILRMNIKEGFKNINFEIKALNYHLKRFNKWQNILKWKIRIICGPLYLPEGVGLAGGGVRNVQSAKKTF